MVIAVGGASATEVDLTTIVGYCTSPSGAFQDWILILMYASTLLL